jgi:hypothetical protein
MSIRDWILQLLRFAPVLLLGLFPVLQAQITGDIEAEIPFSFVVADTTLSPGKYVIHPLGGDDPAMEIRRAEGGEPVTVLITRSVSTSLPPKTELLFNRYENQEFLAKVLVEGNHEKAEIEPSRAEKTAKREGQGAHVHSLPATNRKGSFDPS